MHPGGTNKLLQLKPRRIALNISYSLVILFRMIVPRKGNNGKSLFVVVLARIKNLPFVVFRRLQYCIITPSFWMK